MLKIEKKEEKIYYLNLPRGDNGELELRVDGYTLGQNDMILFKMGKDVTEPLIEKNISDFFENCLSVSLLPDDTKGLPPGKYFYVVKLISSNGEVYTLIEKSVFTLEDS